MLGPGPRPGLVLTTVLFSAEEAGLVHGRAHGEALTSDPQLPGPLGTLRGYATRAVCAEVGVSFVLSCLSWNLRGAL